jgi:uncharacterized membrane protein YgaE (UPF0421/DUF939 family)
MKFIGYRTLKTGIGASIAIIIANRLGLEYAVSAGVITILSIQNTKRQSFKIALQRIEACILGLLTASIIFKILGYNPLTFGIFLLIFIPLAVRLKVSEGIIVSSVLVTHLLVERSVAFYWLLNEISLMLVGVVVALLLNLYMPSIEGQIKQDQIYIEEKIKEILLKMSKALKEHYASISEEELFKDLENRLHAARDRAYKNLNNYFFVDGSYYVKYMEMRMHQFETLKRMREHFQRFYMAYDHTIIVANFTEKVAKSLHEENTCEELLYELYTLREVFKLMPLPSTRDEFENRAMLFQFLNDIEQFLMIKNQFAQEFKAKKR